MMQASDLRPGMRVRWFSEGTGVVSEGTVTDRLPHTPNAPVKISFGGDYLFFGEAAEFELLGLEEPQGIGTVVRDDEGAIYARRFDDYWQILSGEDDDYFPWSQLTIAEVLYYA